MSENGADTRLDVLAKTGMFKIAENPYPGRGIIIGLDETGENLAQVYWIMGRSENSRNRVFALGENGLLATEAADPSKVKDPSLIIYNAMREVSPIGFDPSTTMNVVSNGNQTDRFIEGYAIRRSFPEMALDLDYEPDEPNFTPRITAACYWLDGKESERIYVARMTIAQKSRWGVGCDHRIFQLTNSLMPGFGHCIHTYAGDGNPLPAFQGEPSLVLLHGDAEKIARTYWAALNFDNKVALAVKFIPKSGGPSHTIVLNKYKKVG